MLTMNTTGSNDAAQIDAALDTIAAGMEKALAGFATLRQLLSPAEPIDPTQFDPKDPRNKYDVGGLEKLTPRGVEICYRLFDQGMSRYAVSQAMEISFGGANHRYTAWQKAGGLDRTKQPLD